MELHDTPVVAHSIIMLESTVSWGHMGCEVPVQAGMADGTVVRARLQRSGMGALAPRQGMEALASLLAGAGLPVVSAAPILWDVLLHGKPAPPFFAEFAPAQPAVTTVVIAKVSPPCRLHVQAYPCSSGCGIWTVECLRQSVMLPGDVSLQSGGEASGFVLQGRSSTPQRLGRGRPGRRAGLAKARTLRASARAPAGERTRDILMEVQSCLGQTPSHGLSGTHACLSRAQVTPSPHAQGLPIETLSQV